MFTHSYFSLRFGILSLKELLEEANRNGIDTLALTDINYSGACQEFIRLAPKYNVRPVIGIDFRDGARQLYVGIAKNNEGFKILNDHLSYHLHNKTAPKNPPVSDNIYIIYPLSNYYGQLLKQHEYIGINAHVLSKLPFNNKIKLRNKLIILHIVTFRHKRDFNAHRLLRAIDNNTLLSKLPKSEEGHEQDIMLDLKTYRYIYRQYEDVITQTDTLLSHCQIDYNFGGQHKNQKHHTGSTQEDNLRIRQLCSDGLHYRYPNPTPAVMQRIQKELTTIQEQGFTSYFLINQQIVQYARKKNYFYVGRGSGANSIVAYLLRITDVDPIELDLYFERFINLYRKNPPDFDLDFSWRDREDITRFIFDEFDHVSLLGAYNTFKNKAAMRQLGKVFGLPKRDIEKTQNERIPIHHLDTLSQLVRKYGDYIQDKPSHLSIHAGGILISEKPMHYYTATDLPPKGFPTTQFDMVTAEDIGLYKYDILSQRGLGKIKDCITIIKENNPDHPPFDIHNIGQLIKDKKVKNILRNGQAIGCFYVESPAMRMLLKKLRVDEYLGLVAASSVIRPGVAKSGMMREYILRFRNPERRKDAHPILQEIMPETFGVMVYQEDVIKVAHHFAGLTLGEADVLRRGMSGKYRSREEFRSVKNKFFENCEAKGHSIEITQEIWFQIESFAGYAFSKGHSASYAVESYQSLYLKAHYPLEYMVAVLNNGGGFYRWELYLHEARMHGAQIEAPCIQRSQTHTVIYKQTIYLGLGALKELEYRSVERILNSRKRQGYFTDFYDFVSRVTISLDQTCILIRINAFRLFNKSKKQLLWEAHFLLNKHKIKEPIPELFRSKPKEYKLPILDVEPHEDAFDEMELLGFSLDSPFNLARDPLPSHLLATQFVSHTNQTITTYGYLITVKNTRTSNGKYMHFGTFIDRLGDFIDTVHFPPVAKRYPFRGRGLYKLTGKVVEEFDFYTLELSEMEKLPFIDDPRFAEIKSKKKSVVTSNVKRMNTEIKQRQRFKN